MWTAKEKEQKLIYFLGTAANISLTGKKIVLLFIKFTFISYESVLEKHV